MAYSTPLTFKQFTTDNVSWTPLLAPISCNNYSIVAPNDLKLRTDSTDATTEKALVGTIQEYSFGFVDPNYRWRFPSGTTIFYMQNTTVASQTVSASFTI